MRTSFKGVFSAAFDFLKILEVALFGYFLCKFITAFFVKKLCDSFCFLRRILKWINIKIPIESVRMYHVNRDTRNDILH